MPKHCKTYCRIDSIVCTICYKHCRTWDPSKMNSLTCVWWCLGGRRGRLLRRWMQRHSSCTWCLAWGSWPAPSLPRARCWWPPGRLREPWTQRQMPRTWERRSRWVPRRWRCRSRWWSRWWWLQCLPLAGPELMAWTYKAEKWRSGVCE